MGENTRFIVPAGILKALEASNDETREWLARLPAIVGELLTKWDLRPEGEVLSGEAGIVVPVNLADGTPAALKMQVPRAETRAAILGLVRWDGRGVVRLLDSDTDQGGMLLERLHGDRSLNAVEDDDDAVTVVGGLLARLHRVAAPDGLPHLGAVLSGMLGDAPAALRALEGDDRARLHRWVSRVAELETEPGDRLLHWDLHYENVLAADREPWLAIDPEPLVGDPGFDLWPALDSGWSTNVGIRDAPRIVRRRFDILTEILELDRDRAAGWTAARLLQNTLWDIEDGCTAISMSTKTVDDALAPLGTFGKS